MGIIAFPHNRTVTAWQPDELDARARERTQLARARGESHDCSRCRELEVALKLAEADVARLAKDGWAG